MHVLTRSDMQARLGNPVEYTGSYPLYVTAGQYDVDPSVNPTPVADGTHSCLQNVTMTATQQGSYPTPFMSPYFLSGTHFSLHHRCHYCGLLEPHHCGC